MRYGIFAVVVSLLAISQGATAADQPAFTGSGKTCADITWQPDVLTRFPNIGVVCQGIVEQNGKLYARFNGVVQRRSGSALYIRFKGGENVPGGDHAVLIDPPGDMVIQTAKGKFRVREAQRGQELAIFIPSDRFVVNLGDEIAVAEQTLVEDVVPATEEPPPVEETPPPTPPAQVAAASPPPVEQVTPAPAPVAAPEPVRVPTAPAPVPVKESPPWLLIIGLAIIIVIVVGLVIRNQRGMKVK
jgi:hypothetical protein